MPKLDAAWIKEQLELCEKATPGPWEEYGTGVITYTHPSRDICELGKAWGSWVQRMDNAEFIAAAREGYPLVLKELQDFHASFALYSKACRVGRELFLEAHPEFGELADPDTGEMVAWLVEQVRRRPWAECPRCGDMCLEQDMVDSLCARCAEEEP